MGMSYRFRRIEVYVAWTSPAKAEVRFACLLLIFLAASEILVPSCLRCEIACEADYISQAYIQDISGT